jgi:hypothetical protein
MPFRIFSIYAYTGALLWTGTFISLGKILGPKWEEYHPVITLAQFEYRCAGNIPAVETKVKKVIPRCRKGVLDFPNALFLFYLIFT